uniref:Uncharacterized protein n=1 Tax=Kitasatospora sp. CMC57 TaxID=3231513 RepID=A0AB33K0R6_9ACTN
MPVQPIEADLADGRPAGAVAEGRTPPTKPLLGHSTQRKQAGSVLSRTTMTGCWWLRNYELSRALGAGGYSWSRWLRQSANSALTAAAAGGSVPYAANCLSL